jgi:hypothetical protein
VSEDQKLYPSKPPRIAIFATPGVGKTTACLEELVIPLLKSLPETGLVAITVPTHAKAAEYVEIINESCGPNTAIHYRGFQQEDPLSPGQKMCRESELVNLAIEAGGELRDACGSPQKGPQYCCPYRKGLNGLQCGYWRQIEQIRSMKRGVIVGPHASLHTAPPIATRQRIVLTIIDEAPWLSFVEGFDTEVRVDFKTITSRRSIPKKPIDKDTFFTSGTEVVRHSVATLLNILAQGRLSRWDLRQISNLAFLGELEARRLLDVKSYLHQVRGLPAKTAQAQLRKLIHHNSETKKRMLFWQHLYAATMTQCNRTPMVEYQPGRNGKGGSFLLRRKKAISPGWLEGAVLYADGTANVDLARAFIPDLEVRVDAHVLPGNGVVIRQVTDRLLANRMISWPRETPEANTTAFNHAQKLRRTLEVRSAQFRGRGAVALPPGSNQPPIDGAAIVLKGCRHAMAAKSASQARGKMVNLAKAAPCGSLVLHQNAIRGLNIFERVSYLLVAGRTVPAPSEAELLAEVIFGVNVIQTVSDWYPRQTRRLWMVDPKKEAYVEAEEHPDPNAEIVRRAICEDELCQAVARARHVRRDPSRPVLIEIATSVPLPLPINEVLTYDELVGLASPLVLALARRAIPTTPKGWSVVAPDLVPNARGKINALRHLVNRSDDKLVIKALDRFRGTEVLVAGYRLRRPVGLPVQGSPLRTLLWKWKVRNLTGKNAVIFWLATDDIYEAFEILAALPGWDDRWRPSLERLKGPVELIALETAVKWPVDTMRKEWWRALVSLAHEVSKPGCPDTARLKLLPKLRSLIVGQIRHRP